MQKTRFIDVLMVDTAGRLAIDEEMMNEIKALHAAVKSCRNLIRRRCHVGPRRCKHRTSINEALPLTGVILTKMDGDSRGGAALSVRHVTGKTHQIYRYR